MKPKHAITNTAETMWGLGAVRSLVVSTMVCLSMALTFSVPAARADKPDTDAAGNATDYKNPIQDANASDGNRHWHVTVCEGMKGANSSFIWQPFKGQGQTVASAVVESNQPANGDPKTQVTSGKAHGNESGVSIEGLNLGDGELKITFTPVNGGAAVTVHLTVHVIQCDNTNLHHRGVATALTPLGEIGASSSQGSAGSSPFSGASQFGTNAAPSAADMVTDSFTGVVSDPSKPAANITAYRAGNLAPGDSFSGVVTADTTDTSQLNGLVYQVVEQDPSGNQTVVSQAPVSNGVYKGLIPAVAVTGGAVLIGELLKDGKPVGTATPVPMETQPVETTHPTMTSDSIQIPTVTQVGKPATIRFTGGDGDLTTTHVTVGGQTVQELAEGPNETIFRSPTNLTGVTTVQVSKNGVSATGETRNVAIDLSAGKSMQTGAQEVLTAKVSGLLGLDKPLNVTVENDTAAVTLQDGNIQTVTIDPKKVLPDGTYVFQREIMADHPGTFNIKATVEDPSTVRDGGTDGNNVAQTATQLGPCYSDFHCTQLLAPEAVTRAQCKAAGGKTWKGADKECVSVLSSF